MRYKEYLLYRRCTVKWCGNLHHARGYCKYHYDKITRPRFYKNKKCVVEGCLRKVTATINKKYYCSMHSTRIVRNRALDGSDRERARDQYKINVIEEGNLDYLFNDRTIWARYAKEYYGHKCAICGWDKAECHAHHKIPESMGGQHSLHNAIVLCPNHHAIYHKKLRNS